jgi:hypothetical protein
MSGMNRMDSGGVRVLSKIASLGFRGRMGTFGLPGLHIAQDLIGDSPPIGGGNVGAVLFVTQSKVQTLLPAKAETIDHAPNSVDTQHTLNRLRWRP